MNGEGWKHTDWTVGLFADLEDFWSSLPAGIAIGFCGLVAWLMIYLLVGRFHDQPYSNMHLGFEFRKMAFQGPK